MTLATALKIARTQIRDTGIAMLDRAADPMPRERPYSPGNKRAQLADARARRAEEILAAAAQESAQAARLTAGIDGKSVQIEAKTSLLWWQKRGLSYTRSGYGRRIPTSRMVRLPGETQWRRVYVCIFSNSGTAYVEDRRNPKADGRPGWIVISD
jgi:hypothetical protein